MRNKLLYLLIGTLFLSILISACSKKNQGEGQVKEMNTNQDKGKKEEPLATKEMLMELFQLTEEDLEEIPVNELLSYDNMTEEDLMDLKIHLIDSSYMVTYLKDIQKSMEEEKKIKEEYGIIDFTYILAAKEYEGELPDIDSIHYLVDAYNIGDGGYSCVIDFEKSKIYYNPDNAGIYDDIRYADKVIDLTPEMKEEIIQELEEANLEKWEYEYDEYRGEGSEECFWEFGVEFNDGTIMSTVGNYGTTPKEYKTLRDELYEKLNEY
ncbi:hypothetical protein [Anaerosporobacter sp.]